MWQCKAAPHTDPPRSIHRRCSACRRLRSSAGRSGSSRSDPRSSRAQFRTPAHSPCCRSNRPCHHRQHPRPGRYRSNPRLTVRSTCCKRLPAAREELRSEFRDAYSAPPSSPDRVHFTFRDDQHQYHGSEQREHCGAYEQDRGANMPRIRAAGRASGHAVARPSSIGSASEWSEPGFALRTRSRHTGTHGERRAT
jgi:hypothetical protein